MLFYAYLDLRMQLKSACVLYKLRTVAVDDDHDGDGDDDVSGCGMK